MSPIPTARSLVLLTLALAGCDPSPQSLGQDFPEPEASIRWSTDLDVVTSDLAVAPDGSVFALGMANRNDTLEGIRYDDLALAKLDPDGAIAWSRLEPADEDGDEYTVAIAIDGAGDLHVAIADYGVDAGGDNRLRKLDPDGNERWSVTLPGWPYDVAALPDGGTLVVGRRDAMAWAQQVDADGNLGWSRTFGDPGKSRNELTDVALTPDGGVVVGGLLGVEPAGPPQNVRSWAWIATLEVADGSERWSRKLSEARSGDRVHDLGVTADGTTLVTRSDFDGVVALGADGSTTWSLPLAGRDIEPWLAVYPDGSFAVGGTTIAEYPDCSGQLTCGTEDATFLALVKRFDADRSLRWSLRDPACEGSAKMLTPSADDGLVSSVSCDDDRAIYRFEP